jgi:hypothetical protein
MNPSEDADPQPRITIGLIAAPGLPSDLAHDLAEDLRLRLEELYPDADWHLPTVSDGLVQPPAPTTELIDAAHQRLLREDWELAICLTDLPLRIGRRTLAGHASPTHRLAVISVPALGPARLRRRALEMAVDLLATVLGDTREPTTGRGRAQMRRRLVEFSALADEDPSHGPAGIAALAGGGRLRLLAGMVRANRPWRLAGRLYRALIAALATIAFALVTPDIWGVSGSLSLGRLAILTVISLTVTVVSLIVVHGLWEHGEPGEARDQVLLFNATTAVTVVVGVVSLYAALVAIALAGEAIVVTSDQFSDALGSNAGLDDYLQLAWFVSSLATVGGALGAGLESDVAIREAAYARRNGVRPAAPP